jgi:hypothetical protein
MSAESISNLLGGKRNGGKYRVPAICHGGDGNNLVLWDAPDGKLLAKCFSHGCEYRDIMQVLEDKGYKERDELPKSERKIYAVKKTRLQAQKELQIDLFVLLSIINDRLISYDNSTQERPSMPLEPWEKEVEVARRVFKNLKLAYRGR